MKRVEQAFFAALSWPIFRESAERPISVLWRSVTAPLTVIGNVGSWTRVYTKAATSSPLGHEIRAAAVLTTPGEDLWLSKRAILPGTNSSLGLAM